MEIESEIENKREMLAMEPQFNIYEAFRYFDKACKGYVYVKDLLRGMRGVGVQNITKKSLQLVLKRYDSDNDGAIKFSEFTNAIIPLKDQLAQQMLKRKPESLTLEVQEYMFSYKVKQALTQFLDAMLKVEKDH